MVLLLLLAIMSASCGSEDDGTAADARQCTRLRDHLIALRLSSASGVDKAAHQAAMTQAMGDGFIASCTTKMTAAQVACALKAADAAAAAACGDGAVRN